MKKKMIKLMSGIHRGLYRLTGGAIGGKMMGAPVLLLTTIGRKSGQRRTTPLMYLREGDDLLVIASNAGQDDHPLWWLNLQQNPQAEVVVGREKKTVTARQATPQEHARLWAKITSMYKGYAKYQEMTTRPIPVVILHPTA
jgi:deazaflavin-dependent oxidoreductase (nitroreductase family)